MDKKNYEPAQHLHLGYYEKGYDLEATALHVSGSNEWHVFFPFKDYKMEVPDHYKNAPQEEGFGLLIFTAKDTSNEELQNKFIKWVEEVILPIKGDK